MGVPHPGAPQGAGRAVLGAAHDNEDTAFDVAVQGVVTYGGGLLAVDSSGRRSFLGQDPNRNFSTSLSESRLCRHQRQPAPGYTAAVLDHYKDRRGPYLALHNNHDGWQGNGGSGTISLYRETAVLQGFPSARAEGQLRDEDNLVFLAGARAVVGSGRTAPGFGPERGRAQRGVQAGRRA